MATSPARLPFVLTVLLAASAPAQGDDVSDASLREDLAGGDLRDVAWAAHRVATERRRGFGDALRAALRRLAEDDRGRAALDRRTAANRLLDAMVRTRTPLPAQELAPWIERHEALAIVLGAQQPAEHAGLLAQRIAKSRDDAHWFAACNLVTEHAPELAATILLRNAEVRLRVVVSEDLDLEMEFSGRSGGGGVAPGANPRSLPPVASYRLVKGRRADALVADGPEPISFVRSVRRGFRGPTWHSSPGERADYTWRCLYRLAEWGAADVPMRGRVERSVVWSDLDQLAVDLRALRQGIADDYRELVKRLAERSLCSAREAASSPLQLQIELVDARDEGNREVALPEPAELLTRGADGGR